MARGWESKSIEAQQEAAQQQKPSSRATTPEEAARQGERTTLLLARTRALSELQQACARAHRAMLEQAIAELDRRLSALSVSSSDN
jgi:hypothetical protein